MIFDKVFKLVLAFLLVVFSVLPSGVGFAEAQAPTPVAFPVVFAPYTLPDGTAIYDPADDEHPTSTDITSGIDDGVGLLPSMYVASDGSNFFVRLRVKGNPYDRKGGFLSTVWMVKLLDSTGAHKATIGLNGKPTDKDYVYVANADGSNVEKVYEDSAASNTVPGTRIVDAENGHYFIDFQVPVSKVISIINDGAITSAADFKLEFGTSRAANLSVINKEKMNTVSSGGGAAIKLTQTPLSILIDGGPSKEYSAANKVMTGKTTETGVKPTISINSGDFVEVTTISGNEWTYTLPDNIVSTTGVHKAVVSTTNGTTVVTAKQDVMIPIVSSTELLFIDGGAISYTNAATPTITGTFATGNNGNKIYVAVSDTSTVEGTYIQASKSQKTYSLGVTLNSPVNGKRYFVTAKLEQSGGNGTPIYAKQTLIYDSSKVLSPVTVDITAPTTGLAQPTISGTSSGANQVEVRIDGVRTAFATPNGTGAWSIPALEKPLSTGDHTITAVATNVSGNTAVASTKHTVTAPAITIDDGATVTTNDRTPTIRGNTNAADGATVTVTLNGKSYTTTASNRRWKVEVPESGTLADNTYSVAASITNANATQQLTVDGSTNVSITAPSGSISNTKPEFKGTTEANNAVTLKVTDSSSKVTFIQNLIADGTGKWMYIPTTDLAKDTYSISVVAADAYGNEATATGSFTIADSPAVTVSSVDSVTETVDYGTNVTTAKGKLPSTVTVTLSDNTTKDVAVVWSTDSIPTYNGNVIGSYEFTGTLFNLGDGVTNSNNIEAKGTVIVGSLTVKSAETVTETVDYGTSLSTAKGKLPSSVTMTLSDNTTKDVAVVWSDVTTPTYDGTKPGDYEFTGTLSDLGNAVTNSDNIKAKATVTVSLLKVKSVEAITETVDYGTSLSTAKGKLPSTVTVTLSDNTTKDVAVVWSEDSLAPYNGNTAGDYVFSGNLTLGTDIDNSDNVKAMGTITVKSAILKAGNDILTYSFGLRTATVDSEKHTVAIELPAGTDVTELIASFTLSEGATAKIGTVTQKSSETANDFTSVVTYTVIAENGEEQPWTVTVTLKQQEQTPAPMINPVYVGDTTITGTADAASVVTVKDIGSATADSAGVWTVIVPNNTMLKAGDELSATAKVEDKTESEATKTIVRVNIKSFDKLSYKVFKNTPDATFKALFNDKLPATLDDNSTADVAVVWDLLAVDLTTPDTTTVDATLGTLPENVYNNKAVYPAATVTVLDNLSITGSNDGSKKIIVTGAQPGAFVQLYDSEGNEVGSKEADSEGKVTFTDVDYANDYYVTQTITVNGQSIISPNSSKVDVADLADNKLIISGSIDGLKIVTITNATPGATIKLYNKDGKVVATATADENGKVVFTNVQEGLDYYATETIDGKEAKPSSKVDVLPKIKIRYLEKDIWESVTLDVFAMKQLLSEKYPITWISSDENALKVTAQVDGEYGDYQIETTRPEQEDKSVILTAEFTFEGKKIERTFLLVVKGKNFEEKTIAPSYNDVKLNNSNTPLTGTTVTRTTLTGSGGQQELVDKLIIDENSNLSGDDVSITFDNKSDEQEADEQAVEIASGALDKITGDLTVVTPEGTFNLPQAGIGILTAQGNDLFFRIVPIRSEEEKQAVIDRTKTDMNAKAGAGKQAQVLDIPREIETNYEDIETWITLPIKATFTKAQAEATLRLYIEHTNGQKELVTPGVNGAILVDANGDEVKESNALVAGLKFKISHFSTFTFFKIADVPTSSGPSTPAATPEVVVEKADGSLVENSPVQVSGSAPALSTVELFIDGEFVGTAQTDSFGKWTYDFTNGFTPGTYEIRADVKVNGLKISSKVMQLTIKGKQGAHHRYIYGFGDGTFGPKKLVTRAQMAAMLSRNLTANNIPVASKISFKDTGKHWAADEIEYARISGIMGGYTSSKFGPKDNVTRAQMAAIAIRWIDKMCGQDLTYSQYCDVPSTTANIKDIKGHWAEKDIKRLIGTGIMANPANGKFRPNDKLTREEAVKVLNRLFLRGPLEGVSKPTFTDVSSSYWAFKEIEEAATDHSYEIKNNQEFLLKK